jgi:adenylate kinase
MSTEKPASTSFSTMYPVPLDGCCFITYLQACGNRLSIVTRKCDLGHKLSKSYALRFLPKVTPTPVGWRALAPDVPAAGVLMTVNNTRAAWLEGPSAACQPRPVVAVPRRLILMGAPGVGKGTQADLLRRRLGGCHLSTGDVFRAAASSDCKPSPAMSAALSYMRRGELVPDATVWEMVRERSGCLHCQGGFILDGFPRTLTQAESLKQLMDSEGLVLDAVVNYELPISEIVDRLSGRRTCRGCNGVYHLTQQTSRLVGICDRCGGELFQREDDRTESVTVRMQAYERSTAPLIGYYRNLELLLPIPATGSPEEICERTIKALSRE